MASLYREKSYQFSADDGTPLNGGKVYFYTTGTLTAKATYSDEALTTANANPVVLDADGRSANQIWISGRYRVRLETSAGVLISDDDPIEDVVSGTDFQDANPTWGGVATGTANALTITLTPAPSAYTAGMVIRCEAAFDNTGATTINANSLGVKNILKSDGTALIAGDIQDGDILELTYNGTSFEISSPQVGLFRNGNNAPARVDVASAATVDLDAAASNYVRITGTTTITAITLADGRSRDVVFGGALTLTNGASLILPGGANITTAAGDTATLIGEASGVVRCISYMQAATPPSGVTLISRTTVGAGVASVDISLAYPGYRNFMLEIDGMRFDTDNVIAGMRVSEDGGSTFKSGVSDYGWSSLRTISTGVQANISDSDSEIQLSALTGLDNTDAAVHWSGTIKCFNPAGGLNKIFTWHAGFLENDGTFNIFTGSARYKGTTNAINSLRVYAFSGNIAAGTFSLYGLP